MLQSRVHIVIAREIRARIGFGQRYMENIFKSEQRQNNVRPLHKKEIVHVKTITSSSLRYIQH